MAGIHPLYDLDASVKPLRASNGASIVAAGAGDNSAVTGVTIDRLGYMAAKLVLAWSATLAANKKLSLAVEYQESADGSSWDTAVVLQALAAVATDSGAGSTMRGITEFDLNLKARKRYIRFNFTPDLDAGATDTAFIHALALLAGRDTLPVP